MAFRTAKRIPQNAVNLCYYETPPLDLEEYVYIAESGALTSESFVTKDIEMRPDKSHLLRTVTGSSDIPGKVILITDVFMDGVPLYYCHVLSNLIYDPEGPDAYGFVRGQSIFLSDRQGNPLSNNLKWKVKLEPEGDLYRATIYTSFLKSNGYLIHYHGIDTAGGIVIPVPNKIEVLNPQPAFVRTLDISKLLSEKRKKFFLAGGSSFDLSRCYVAERRVDDTRTPVSFTWRGRCKKNDVDLATTDSMTGSVFNEASLLPGEVEEYALGFKAISTKPIKDLFDSNPEADAEPGDVFRYSVEIVDAQDPVSIKTRDDGLGLVYARTTADTGIIQVAPESERLIDESGVAYLSPKYSVKMVEDGSIRLLMPKATGPNDPWYIRIKAGRFERDISDGIRYSYFCPDYYQQNFDPDLGAPYVRATGEEVQVIGLSQVLLKNKPLFVTETDDGSLNITITVRGVPQEIESWDSATGLVTLKSNIAVSDIPLADYVYEEDSYAYTGYRDDQGRFIHLDLNPSNHHFSMDIEHIPTDSVIDEERIIATEISTKGSFSLINKTIYFYIKPTVVLTNYHCVPHEELSLDASNIATLAHTPIVDDDHPIVVRKRSSTTPVSNWTLEDGQIKFTAPDLASGDCYVASYFFQGEYEMEPGSLDLNSVFHSFEPLTDPNLILIGEVYVRPSSSKESVTLIDARSRGGGVVDPVSATKAQPEVRYYYDIGLPDGTLFQAAGVLVVDVPRTVLREFGGSFTQDEVQSILHKHVAWGHLVIPNFI
jgi:hypothetical protein